MKDYQGVEIVFGLNVSNEILDQIVELLKPIAAQTEGFEIAGQRIEFNSPIFHKMVSASGLVGLPENRCFAYTTWSL